MIADVGEFMAHRKRRLATVEEARMALEHDKLGAVYRNAEKVWVMTSHGIGSFTPEEWDEAEEGACGN
jgi:hypothetical protein